MNLKYVILGTALLAPMTLLSCDDSKVPTEVAVDDPSSDVDVPSFTTVGFGSRWHDPHINGPKVRTFTLNSDCSDEPQVKRFKSEDGAELSTYGENFDVIAAFANEENCMAAVYPVNQKIKGKKLTAVNEIDFSYAGGNNYNAPTIRIPIDECREVSPEHTSSGPQECGTISFQFTDGVIEDYAYINADECSDGDGNVGVVNAEDKEYNCTVRYNYDSWNSWADFVADHPYDRVAKKLENGDAARTEVFLSPNYTGGQAHYLVWMLDIR